MNMDEDEDEEITAALDKEDGELAEEIYFRAVSRNRGKSAAEIIAAIKQVIQGLD